MSDTAFVNGTTLSDADWFNDVNRLHYTIFGDPANIAAVVATFAASQAQQETGSSNSVAVTPGRQHFHASALKFWGECDAAGNLGAVSYNITSVADRGTGQVDVVIATDFSTTTYNISLGLFDADNANHIAYVSSSIGQVAGGFTIDCGVAGTGALQDPVGYYFSGAGDQA